jgi:hypothetical protein
MSGLLEGGTKGLDAMNQTTSRPPDVIDFLEQEFGKRNRSPLTVLNGWIERGLIQWDEDIRRIVEDWDKNGEPVQPVKDKRDFLRLTGVKYTGP